MDGCSRFIQLVFKFLQISMSILRIVIPLSLIVLISMEYYKAVLSNDENSIKKATSSAIRRFIAGVVVFFIPTIVTFVFGLFKGQDNSLGELYECAKKATSSTTTEILDKDKTSNDDTNN